MLICLSVKSRQSSSAPTSLERVTAPGETGRRVATDPKAVIRRLIEEVINTGDLDVIGELYSPHMTAGARRWIAPFRESFPDVQMEIIALIAEGDTVVGRFRCSGTHLGARRGHQPTGRRFERVDEVYIFRVRDGRIIEAWGIEDTRSRERQLGLLPGR